MQKLNEKDLPIFEFYDSSNLDFGVPTSQELKLAQKLYIFCKENKTNEVLARNLASGEEFSLKVNLNLIKKHLEKEGFIN